MMPKITPSHFVLSGLLVVIGAVGFDVMRRPSERPIDPKTAEVRVKELYQKSGGDFNRLGPAERAEALKLEPIARKVLLRPQPDPVEEKKLLAIWKRRGKRWKNMTEAERARAYRYMMERRAIPEIQQSMDL